MRCQDCRSQLAIGATFCDCGWRAVSDSGEKKVVFRPCHFTGEGKCRYDRDRGNRHAKPIGATVRINEYWICNYHYEHGYDRYLRGGEPLPLHEQKNHARLFGAKQDDEAIDERKAIMSEGT